MGKLKRSNGQGVQETLGGLEVGLDRDLKDNERVKRKKVKKRRHSETKTVDGFRDKGSHLLVEEVPKKKKKKSLEKDENNTDELKEKAPRSKEMKFVIGEPEVEEVGNQEERYKKKKKKKNRKDESHKEFDIEKTVDQENDPKIEKKKKKRREHSHHDLDIEPEIQKKKRKKREQSHHELDNEANDDEVNNDLDIEHKIRKKKKREQSQQELDKEVTSDQENEPEIQKKKKGKMEQTHHEFEIEVNNDLDIELKIELDIEDTGDHDNEPKIQKKKKKSKKSRHKLDNEVNDNEVNNDQEQVKGVGGSEELEPRIGKILKNIIPLENEANDDKVIGNDHNIELKKKKKKKNRKEQPDQELDNKVTGDQNKESKCPKKKKKKREQTHNKLNNEVNDDEDNEPNKKKKKREQTHNELDNEANDDEVNNDQEIESKIRKKKNNIKKDHVDDVGGAEELEPKIGKKKKKKYNSAVYHVEEGVEEKCQKKKRENVFDSGESKPFNKKMKRSQIDGTQAGEEETDGHRGILQTVDYKKDKKSKKRKKQKVEKEENHSKNRKKEREIGNEDTEMASDVTVPQIKAEILRKDTNPNYDSIKKVHSSSPFDFSEPQIQINSPCSSFSPMVRVHQAMIKNEQISKNDEKHVEVEDHGNNADVSNKEENVSKHAHCDDDQLSDVEEDQLSDMEEKLEYEARENFEQTNLARDAKICKLSSSFSELQKDIFQIMDTIEVSGPYVPINVPFEESHKDPSFYMREHYTVPILDDPSDQVLKKVMDWIFQFDFPLPKLNRIVHRRFWYLPKEALHRIRKEIPNFKSGKFEEFEEEIILTRLKIMMKALKLSRDDVSNMFHQMKCFKRGAKQQSRLIMGAFLGQPMLHYRRAFDIFHHVEVLVKRRKQTKKRKTDQKLIKKIVDFLDKFYGNRMELGPGDIAFKHVKECRLELGLTEEFSNYEVASIYRKYRKMSYDIKTGPFDEKDLYSLFTAVCEQLRTTEAIKMNLQNISWDPIAAKLSRKVNTLKLQWNRKLFPLLLSADKGIERNMDQLKLNLFTKILEDESIVKRKQIDWNKMQKFFPMETKDSLRYLFDNCYIFDKDDFRTTLEDKLQYLKDNPPTYNTFAKDDLIIQIFERVKSDVKDKF